MIQKDKKYECIYNFRDELIQFTIQRKESKFPLFQINIYENYPNAITYYDLKTNIYYVRHWQWVVRRSKWEPTLTYLSFKNLNDSKKFEYFFSRYSGGLVRKLTYFDTNERIYDGWNFNYEDKDTLEKIGDRCYLFKQGVLLSTALKECKFELFDITISVLLDNEVLDF